MAELYKDKKLIAECHSLEETNEPMFTKILHEICTCLGCGYTLWKRHCITCTLIEITSVEAMHKHRKFGLCRERILYIKDDQIWTFQ